MAGVDILKGDGRIPAKGQRLLLAIVAIGEPPKAAISRRHKQVKPAAVSNLARLLFGLRARIAESVWGIVGIQSVGILNTNICANISPAVTVYSQTAPDTSLPDALIR